MWVSPKLYVIFSRSEIVYQNSISILGSNRVSTDFGQALNRVGKIVVFDLK